MSKEPSAEEVRAVAQAMAEDEGWLWDNRDGATNMVDKAWSAAATSRARDTWRIRARAAIIRLDQVRGK